MKFLPPIALLSLLLVGCQPNSLKSEQLISEPSYDASLSQQGDLALISTADNGLQLWDLKTNKQKYTWIHGETDNTAIDTAISPNQAFAASLSKSSVALWSIKDGDSLGWWSLPSTGQSLAVADTGALLIGLTDGSVMSLKPNAASLIKFLGHSEKVNSVALSADGKLALSGANDKQAIFWDTATGQPIHTWVLDSRIIKVELNREGSLSFIGDSTNVAQILENKQGQLLSQLKIYRRIMNFSAARFSANNRLLFTGTPAREVIVWDVASGYKVANWQVHRTEHAQIKGAVVYSVANAGVDKVISISSNGLVETWPLEKE